jgi:hypothetical protein
LVKELVQDVIDAYRPKRDVVEGPPVEEREEEEIPEEQRKPVAPASWPSKWWLE